MLATPAISLILDCFDNLEMARNIKTKLFLNFEVVTSFSLRITNNTSLSAENMMRQYSHRATV